MHMIEMPTNPPLRQTGGQRLSVRVVRHRSKSKESGVVSRLFPHRRMALV